MKCLHTFLISIAAISLLLLGSCGQSGPLYIPGDPSQMAVPPSGNSGAEEEDNKQKNDGDPSSKG